MIQWIRNFQEKRRKKRAMENLIKQIHFDEAQIVNTLRQLEVEVGAALEGKIHYKKAS